MGNAISRMMDYVGKAITNTRKGSPRYRTRKKRWKNKKDLANYRMVRGHDIYEDELFEEYEDGVQVVQL
tara:strand:- start:6419 stop:6625 length:207 start_codon:yes stop_codon:yes gene_type:complete